MRSLFRPTLAAWLFVSLLLVVACKKETAKPVEPASAAAKKTVGLVTDVGGRGDQSFNDSAIRGLEVWAASSSYASGKYQKITDIVRSSSIPKELGEVVKPLAINPLVVQSKSQEDYQPNLQLLVDEGAALTVGTGFMLENAVEAVAASNPKAKFLLIDSPLLDSKGTPKQLPNVRTVTFKEEEGSFLVGAMAAQVATQKVGFVGGMEIPLIKKFEAGFRAGANYVNPKIVTLIQYTGSFDNVQAGKQAAADLLTKGAEVIFHAAGSDGLGVIQAVKEARAAGKKCWAIGVDSDQSHVAPEVVLTSMVKRVDLAVYTAASDLLGDKFTAGDIVMGLKENGVTFAEVRVELDNKAAILEKLAALKESVISKKIQVPADDAALKSFLAAPRP
jgi:basic membrane protein A and related proteins